MGGSKQRWARCGHTLLIVGQQRAAEQGSFKHPQATTPPAAPAAPTRDARHASKVLHLLLLGRGLLLLRRLVHLLGRRRGRRGRRLLAGLPHLLRKHVQLLLRLRGTRQARMRQRASTGAARSNQLKEWTGRQPALAGANTSPPYPCTHQRLLGHGLLLHRLGLWLRLCAKGRQNSVWGQGRHGSAQQQQQHHHCLSASMQPQAAARCPPPQRTRLLLRGRHRLLLLRRLLALTLLAVAGQRLQVSQLRLGLRQRRLLGLRLGRHQPLQLLRLVGGRRGHLLGAACVVWVQGEQRLGVCRGVCWAAGPSTLVCFCNAGAAGCRAGGRTHARTRKLLGRRLLQHRLLGRRLLLHRLLGGLRAQKVLGRHHRLGGRRWRRRRAAIAAENRLRRLAVGVLRLAVGVIALLQRGKGG